MAGVRRGAMARGSWALCIIASEEFVEGRDSGERSRSPVRRSGGSGRVDARPEPRGHAGAPRRRRWSTTGREGDGRSEREPDRWRIGRLNPRGAARPSSGGDSWPGGAQPPVESCGPFPAGDATGAGRHRSNRIEDAHLPGVVCVSDTTPVPSLDRSGRTPLDRVYPLAVQVVTSTIRVSSPRPGAGTPERRPRRRALSLEPARARPRLRPEASRGAGGRAPGLQRLLVPGRCDRYPPRRECRARIPARRGPRVPPAPRRVRRRAHRELDGARRGAPRGGGGERPATPQPDRVRRAGARGLEPGDRAPRRARARRGPGPRAPVRAARPRQDQPGAHPRRRAGRRAALDDWPGPRATEGPGRDPDPTPARRGPVRRRDPSRRRGTPRSTSRWTRGRTRACCR